MRYLHTISVAAAAMLFTGSASAQGDICTGATSISCGSTVSGTTVGWGADNAPFCVIPNGTQGAVWFRFAGTGATVTASLCGSGYDTGIRVYSGTCATLPCVTGNGDFCGLQSQVTWTSVLGTTYYILVSGFGTAAGPYTLTLSCVAPVSPMCYAQTAIPYAADPYTGTAITLTDDVHSGVIPIGFNFCYNDNNYSQCVISSNNYITFNTSTASTYSPYVVNAVPSATPATLQNAILNPWHDTYPPAGGSIRYQTLGTAPNRRFVVSFQNVPMFSCNSLLVTNQLILYEGTNCIASYTLNKPVCSTSNSGNAVHALQNVNGTSATIVPGRNNSSWTAVSEGRLFTPTCAPCSTAATSQCLLLLPVELLRFRGHSEANENVLEWATASEQNTDVFIVERSEDGGAFEPMVVLAGAGNSSTTREYKVSDPDPAVGMNYYRLRQVDLDGAEEMSETIVLEFSPAGEVELHPNPGHGIISFAIPEGTALPARMELRDMAGRVVHHHLATHKQGVLLLEGLAPGTYALILPGAGSGRAARLVLR